MFIDGNATILERNVGNLFYYFSDPIQNIYSITSFRISSIVFTGGTKKVLTKIFYFLLKPFFDFLVNIESPVTIPLFVVLAVKSFLFSFYHFP